MKIYRIFLKKTNEGVIDDLELLREGFSVWAFVFQLFYLIYRRLWKQSLVVLVMLSILNLLQLNFLSEYIVVPIQICICIYIGFEYTDWYSQKLVNTGYQFLGYSSGNDEKEAKIKFLDSINNNYTKDDKLEQKIF